MFPVSFLQFPEFEAIEHSPHHDSFRLLSLCVISVAVLWLEFDLHLETCFSASVLQGKAAFSLLRLSVSVPVHVPLWGLSEDPLIPSVSHLYSLSMQTSSLQTITD